ncbi:hypothetical protein [Spongiactinospora gelatinilytica]|uniref:hypothetical protein n=1 Tax=Spongiactinospora gelatinilytica TaxID=2666298 RepID=UPI0011B93F93|nr:hypothetical protein [Spongiactinospora gelatinilytica]
MLTGDMIYLFFAVAASLPLGPYDDDIGVSSQYTGYVISARDRPDRPSATQTRKKPNVTCSYQPWHVSDEKNAQKSRDTHNEAFEKGTHYLVKCSDGSGDVVWNGTGDHIWVRPDHDGRASPEKLARRAYKLIPITPPSVSTAPPRGRDGLVGLPHWFWLADEQWTAKSKRLRAGSVWAEATATPQQMTINTGDGRRLTCNGPGTAYDPTRPPERQKTTCSHLYEQPAHGYRVTVSVTWGGSWRGSGGTGGTLPPITRSVTFPVRVVEAQAPVVRE